VPGAASIRQAASGDLEGIVELLADAYADDPFFRWMVPDDGGWPAFARDYFGFVVARALPAEETLVAAELDGTAVWTPPGFQLLGAGDLGRAQGLLTDHLGERARLALAGLLGARRHEPEQEHATLIYIAVRSDRQGLGIAGELIRQTLGELDEAGVGAYLVSTNPRNLGFYERAGFRTLAEVQTPDGAITTHAMWRSPPEGQPG
jgi:ribosomal protein S18 acetylase RimI-like enzyme